MFVLGVFFSLAHKPIVSIFHINQQTNGLRTRTPIKFRTNWWHFWVFCLFFIFCCPPPPGHWPLRHWLWVHILFSLNSSYKCPMSGCKTDLFSTIRRLECFFFFGFLAFFSSFSSWINAVGTFFFVWSNASLLLLWCTENRKRFLCFDTLNLIFPHNVLF